MIVARRSAANIFVGMVEAPLFIKPYLTRIEARRGATHNRVHCAGGDGGELLYIARDAAGKLWNHDQAYQDRGGSAQHRCHDEVARGRSVAGCPNRTTEW